VPFTSKTPTYLTPEQRYALTQYQGRSDRAMRRHWQLVCCAFSFCWYHASHPAAQSLQEPATEADSSLGPAAGVPAGEADTGEKISHASLRRPQVSWPVALGAVRAWLEPWIMLRRYWHGWSPLPPSPELRFLLAWLERGQAISLYSSA